MNSDRLAMPDDADRRLDRLIEAAKSEPVPAEVQARALTRVLATVAGDEPSGRLSEPGKRRGRQELENGCRGYDTAFPSHLFQGVVTMIVRHKRLTAATAGLIAMATSLIFYVTLFSYSAPAYALEQTVQANQRVSSYHAKISSSQGLSEVWVQLNADGSPLRTRIDYLRTEDGDKVVICSEGKTAVWFRDKNVYGIHPTKDALDRVVQMQKMCDPREAFEGLQARKAAGKAQIETTEPAKAGDFVKLTATSAETPDLREVYEVNPTTKLAERVIYYSRQGEEWVETKRLEFLDYQPIDPKVFDLELPEDVARIDHIKRPAGLPKGELTKEQIVTKVAREFFQAMIAKDYDRAGVIFAGFSAEKIKEWYGKEEIAKILELSEPKAGLHPDPKALAVAVKVQLVPRKWEQKFAVQVPLTDNAATTKAAREFGEALLRHDIAAARRALEGGLVFEGFGRENADKLPEFFEHYKLLRLVEVGKPHPQPESNRLAVPLRLEVEEAVPQTRDYQLFSRPAEVDSDNWGICDLDGG